MNIIEQLRRDEGVRHFPYKDTVGKITIGVGRNLTDVGISDAEIDYLLQNDVNKATNGLVAELPWVALLDEPRRMALTNMAFNLGIKGLLKFDHTLGLIQQNQWDQASEAMLQSLWAKQVGNRAERLSQQIKTGQWN